MYPFIMMMGGGEHHILFIDFGLMSQHFLFYLYSIYSIIIEILYI